VAAKDRFYNILIEVSRLEIRTMKFLPSCIIAFILTMPVCGQLHCQSPYKISWEKDGYIVGVGTIIGLTALVLDRSVQPLTLQEVNQLARGSINQFDRSAAFNYSKSVSHTSDVMAGIALAAPAALLTDQSIRKDWQTITLMYLETYGWSRSVSALTKASVKRIRPFVYNPDAPLDRKLSSGSRKSFYSEHSSEAFASAVFISTVYSDYNPNSEWKPFIWAGSLLTASVVGYLRYEAGKHFPTDILVGTIVGSAIGYTIPWMHRVGKENISITPGVQGADYGFSVQVKF
jgi:membrane-associated phospholipid phosphatase